MITVDPQSATVFRPQRVFTMGIQITDIPNDNHSKTGHLTVCYSDNLLFRYLTPNILVSITVGDLNSKLIQCSDHRDLFNRQMVRYSDAWYHVRLVLGSTFC